MRRRQVEDEPARDGIDASEDDVVEIARSASGSEIALAIGVTRVRGQAARYALRRR